MPTRINIKDLKSTIDSTLKNMGGVTLVNDDIINVEVKEDFTFEQVVARGQELGNKLANAGRLEEALNVLRKNLGMVDEDTKAPATFDTLVPSQIDLAKLVVVQLEELCETHKIK